DHSPSQPTLLSISLTPRSSRNILFHGQDWLKPSQLQLRHAVVQDDVNGCAEIKAMVRRNIYEFVAMAANDRRYGAILCSKDVHGVHRVSKSSQALGAL